MKTKYIVIIQRAWCNDSGIGIIYSSDQIEFDKRDQAIGHGFKLSGSDDFNIGVLVNDSLVSIDWMNQSVDTKPYVLREAEKQLCMI
ncbi:antitoxin [Xenorhabdus littoralis]|uniref:antitoxin n=1 Tax=Xenorhabdus littoralis TaxID=2582835 RepID=UPI0029E8289A|nr:antitoxin [Xenorhabdus sp. psl]